MWIAFCRFSFMIFSVFAFLQCFSCMDFPCRLNNSKNPCNISVISLGFPPTEGSFCEAPGSAAQLFENRPLHVQSEWKLSASSAISGFNARKENSFWEKNAYVWNYLYKIGNYKFSLLFPLVSHCLPKHLLTCIQVI